MTAAHELDLTEVHPEFARRFWSKVDVRGDDECWEWTAHRKASGYGQFVLRKGVFITASRAALALSLGRPVRSYEHACHRCDNPPCCNPAHLFAGTVSENILDCVAKGGKNAATGERHPSVKLSEAQVREILSHPTRRGIGEELARQFGVSGTVIRKIRTRQIWRHIDAECNPQHLCIQGHPLEGANLLSERDRSSRSLCATCAEDFRLSRHVKRSAA